MGHKYLSNYGGKEKSNLEFFRFWIIHAESIYGDSLHHLIFQGFVGIIGGCLGNAVYDIHTFYYLSKRRIAAVQMGGVLVHNEELGTCGVGMSGSGHGKHSLGVL